MDTESAKHRVLLGIPELLEAILLHLDQKTLIVNAQRVCRQWHECITEIPSIQRHLFLRPELIDNHSRTGADSEPPRPNPLLARHFPEWFEHCKTWPPDQRLPFVRTTEPSPGRLNNDHLFPTLPWVHRRLDAYAYPGASWRRMLLQQPPRNGLGFVMTHYGRPLRGELPEHSNLGDLGEMGELARLNRPVTMPELLELTNMCIHIRHATRRDQLRPPSPERHAVARFRVMWGRLSPEVTPPQPGFDPNVDLYTQLKRAMDKYGIVVQHDSCPHQSTEPDPFLHSLGALWVGPS
ncbi:hypothetical protein PG989_012938 [Apiospora arundinis]